MWRCLLPGRVSAVCLPVFVALLAGCSAPVAPSPAASAPAAPAASEANTAEPIAADLAILGVAVIDVQTGTASPPQDVFVADGSVVAVAPAGTRTPPTDAVTVDGAGQYVMPGLWDAHVHSAASRVWHFPALLAHGITSVRNLHTSEPNALGRVASIREELESGAIVGPRFLANGALVDGDPPVSPDGHVLSDPQAADEFVRSQKQGGADFIKIYSKLSLDVFDAVMAAAKKHRLPVDGHLPVAVPAAHAAAAGMRTMEHGTGTILGCMPNLDVVIADSKKVRSYRAFLSFLAKLYETRDLAKCHATAQAFRENGVTIVPTLVAGQSDVAGPNFVDDGSAMASLPPTIAEGWRGLAKSPGMEAAQEIVGPITTGQLELVRLLHEEGVTLLAGTDIGNPFLLPGRSLHRELALLVKAGLSPLEALKTATIHPAQVFGLSGTLGSVEPGYLADLVLLKDNPVEDIRHVTSIAGVVAQGVYYSAATLEQMRQRGVTEFENTSAPKPAE